MNLSNLASNITMPLRPKEWYVVVLPGPFFESSKDAKCLLKESNWKLADMLNQLMSQNRYARLTWQKIWVCGFFMFVQRLVSSADGSHPRTCDSRAVDLPSRTCLVRDFLFSQTLWMHQGAKQVMPKLPIRRPGRNSWSRRRAMLAMFYPQGSLPETLETLHDLVPLCFCWRNGFGDQEIQTGSEALFSIFARWCGAGSFAWRTCDNCEAGLYLIRFFSKMMHHTVDG